jgi:hypothetical protein
MIFELRARALWMTCMMCCVVLSSLGRSEESKVWRTTSAFGHWSAEVKSPVKKYPAHGGKLLSITVEDLSRPNDPKPSISAADIVLLERYA